MLKKIKQFCIGFMLFICCSLVGNTHNDLYEKLMSGIEEFCNKEYSQKTTVSTLLAIMCDYTKAFSTMNSNEIYEFRVALNDYIYERFREYQKEMEECEGENKEKNCGLIFVVEFVHDKVLSHYSFDEVLAFFVVVGLSEQFLAINR